MARKSCLRDDQNLVASIDIGTSYSGYAFSFRVDYDKDPCIITTNNWSSEAGTAFSHKAPSSVLLKEDMSFDSFGYEAEKKFAKLAEKEENMKWFFIRQFKMSLKKENLQRHMLVRDIHGKYIPAVGLFVESIRYLKNHMLKEFKTRGLQLVSENTQYVITVPAIWSDAAKQVMREAAVRAGILEKNLKLAYEPESAAMHCITIPSSTICGDGGPDRSYLFQPGKKFLVLDLGGGTADITVQELASNGKFRQIHVSGGPWGGTTVNRKFNKILFSIFGEKNFVQFCRECMADYLTLENTIEIKKREITQEETDPVVIYFPVALKEIYEENTKLSAAETIRSSPHRLEIKRDKLIISAETFKGLFDYAISNIKDHVEGVLETPVGQGVSTILMVGGFSESKLVSQAIRNHFKNLEVVVPIGCGLSVLKGSVLYGHNPNVVRTRACPYTFGIGVDRKFQDGHDQEKFAFMKNGRKYASGCFEKMFTVGEIIEVGDTRNIPVYDVFGENSEAERKLPKTIDMYSSLSQNPRHISDEDVRRIGVVVVSPAGGMWPKRVEGNVMVTMGGTEITVSYLDKDMKTSAWCKIDFIEETEDEQQQEELPSP